MSAGQIMPPPTAAAPPGVCRLLFFFGVGSLAFWLFLEGLFRLLPVERAPLVGPINEQTPLKSRTASVTYTHSYGWRLDHAHRTRTNAQGFIHASDYIASPIDLAAIGDSYIEAGQLLRGEHFTSLLSAAGLAPEAYAWGASGAAASDYLAMANWVRERHAPRYFSVLFIKNDIEESLVCERGRSCLRRKPAGGFELVTEPWKPSRAYELLYRSDLLNYMARNLRFKPRRLIEPAPMPARVTGPAAVLPERLETMDAFLALWPEYANVPPAHTALIFDADREAIDRGQFGVSDPEFVAFMDKARSAGYRVVDMRKHFEAHRRASRARFDFRPLDGHWNALAHRLAADAVSEALGLAPGSASSPPQAELPASCC